MPLLLGAVLGAVLGLSNIYAGLKLGIAFPVASTAAVLGQAVNRTLRRVRPRASPLGLDGLVSLQSTASAAGYSTGSALVSSSAAYLIIVGHHPSLPVLMLWTFLLAALGVLVAAPLRRPFIDVEQLPFPSGTAAAVTLRALEGETGVERGLGRRLTLAGVFAAAVAWGRDGLGWIPAALALPGSLFGVPLAALTFSLETGLVSLGAGALMGLRTTASMVLGAVLCFGILAPALHAHGMLPVVGFVELLPVSLWVGTALLTGASLTHLLFQRQAIVRGLRGVLPPRGVERASSREEIPARWLLVGLGMVTPAIVVLAWFAFGVTPGLGLLAVALAAVLCVVSCRVTGETDVTPAGPLVQGTQLVFGLLAPANAVASLMTAGITATSAAAGADLLTDLKTGALLGASPRRQFVAQLWGAVVGATVVVPAFVALVGSPSVLGTSHFPAPGAQMLVGFSRVMSSGWSAISGPARAGMAAGLVMGALLTWAEARAPQRARAWIPSALGLGLAFLIPASTSFSFFLGGAVAQGLGRFRPAFAEQNVLPVASGLIVGEGLAGVLIALRSVLF